jgi:hypothetical protein
MTSTRDITPGDVIEVKAGGDIRRLVVHENHEDGLVVIWFTPEGLGPYRMKLPHTDNVEQLLYENEAAGMGNSWWDTHPDMKD